MMKKWMHILVISAFAVSAMPSIALTHISDQISAPYQNAYDIDFEIHNTDHYIMTANHSCCDKQPADKQCAYDACQCVTASCAQTQILQNPSAIVSIYPDIGFTFSLYDERVNNSLSQNLDHPPQI